MQLLLWQREWPPGCCCFDLESFCLNEPRARRDVRWERGRSASTAKGTASQPSLLLPLDRKCSNINCESTCGGDHHIIMSAADGASGVVETDEDIVCPGNRLASASVAAPGEGTYVRDGHVYARCAHSRCTQAFFSQF